MTASLGVSITVAVPSYDRALELERCLRAVKAQVYPDDRVVAVLRPDDEPGREVAHRLGVEALGVHEPGDLPPLVEAVAACHSEVIAFLDDDAVPRAHWRAVLQTRFADRRAAGLTGPVVDHPPVRRSARGGRSAVHRATRHRGRSWYGGFKGLPTLEELEQAGVLAPFAVDHASGGCMAFRTSALRRCGVDLGLNRGAAVGYEADCCLGAQRTGIVLFDPAFVVDHYPAPRRGAPEREDALQYALDYRHNLGRIAGKHFGRRERLVFSLYMGVVGQAVSPGLLRSALGPVARLDARLALSREARRQYRLGLRGGLRVRGTA